MFDIFDSASVQAIAYYRHGYDGEPCETASGALRVVRSRAYYLALLRYIGERMLRTLASTYHDLPPALPR